MSRPVFVQWQSVCAALLLIGWGGPAQAQDHTEYDPADIEYGLSVYRSQCVTCHGDTGDGIAGSTCAAASSGGPRPTGSCGRSSPTAFPTPGCWRSTWTRPR